MYTITNIEIILETVDFMSNEKIKAQGEVDYRRLTGWAVVDAKPLDNGGISITFKRRQYA